MSIFDALTQAFDQRRQADSVANTVLPFIPGGQPPAQPPQPSGGFFDQLLGLVGGQQPPPALQQAGPFASLIAPSQQRASPFSAPTAAPMSFVAPSAAPTMASPAPAPTPRSAAPSVGGYMPRSAAIALFGPQPDSVPSNVPVYGRSSADALPTFAAAGGTPGQDNTSRALSFYQSKGLSPLAAAALVGGFHAESGPSLNTRAVNVGDGQDGSNSIGIPQWNGDRARGFLNFARSNNLDPHDIDTQLQYSWLELNGPEKGTLAALQQAQNPAQATAAALGYERPAGWTAQNPYGAKTFGSRLKNTVGLASTGFNTPFDGSAIGPNPNGFTPDPSQGGGLPAMAASGYGMNLSPATPFPAGQSAANTPAAPLPLAGSGGTSTSGGYVAYDSRGKAVKTDAAGNALDADGQPTALAYGGVPAASPSAAPASRAIANAAPIDDPLVTVPGYSGQWNRSRIAAAPDGTDVPDDGELARAQSGSLGGTTREAVQVPTRGPGTAVAGSLGGTTREAVQVPTRGPGTAVAGSIAAPRMQMPSPAAAPMQSAAPSSPLAASQASGGFAPISPQMIGALIRNPDTQQFGLALWQNMLTNKTAPIVGHAGDVILDGRTGQPIYSIPNKPEVTDAIKNYQFSQSNPAFAQYQADQQKGDKAQLVEVPLPDGRMQNAWAPPGQIPTPDSYVGAPYTPRPLNSVTIDQKAESAQEGEYGKVAGQQLGEVMKAGATAPQALQQVAMLRAAAAQAGDSLSTGPFGPFALKAKQALGNALGVEIPGTKEGEVINNIGYGLATQAARAISNRPTQMEFANALSVKPGLSLSPQGMTAVLNIREQDLKDQIALAKLASNKDNRTNWPAVVADYYDQHPVMSPFDPSRPLGAQDVQAINGSQQAASPSTISTQDAAALPVISSPADAAKLKPGTLFKTPDGRIKQR